MKRMVVLLLVVSILASGTAACRTRPPASPSMVTPGPAATPSTVPSGSEVVFEFSAVDASGRAVAFHSIDLIDAEANTLGTLELGTPETDARQGEGWLETGTSPQVGAFRWAGGPDRRATLRLDLPDGTEGLLLHVNSVQNGLWMTVTVGGEPAAVLRTDDYWHLGYVPLGEATPALAPDAEPEWVEGRYFPTFPPPPGRVYAIRVRTALEDWWGAPSDPGWRINQSFDTLMALTLAGMQGLINRNGGSVYLDWEDAGKYNDTAHFWIPSLRDYADVVALDLDGLSAVNFLLRRYPARFKGAVIYDPEVPDTINLATILAGLEDRMILAPQQLGLSGIPEFESVVDLRVLAEENGWDATAEGQYQLYEWAYENLWPRLEHRIVGVISPGPPTSEQIVNATNYLPLGMAARDYIVALRLAALWLSPSEEPQASLFARFLQDAPSPIPVLGFYGNDEVGTVQLAASHGDWVPVITNGNAPLSPASLTLHSALPVERKPYPAEINADRLLATLDARYVVALFTSDGDSIHYLMDRGFRELNWEQVQGYRLGWTINPTLIDLAPLAWKHYVDSRSEVSLVTGMSGAGYTAPAVMNDAQLRGYLAYTRRYLDETGLRVIAVSNRDVRLKEEVASTYYESLRGTGYLGLIAGGSVGLWGLGFLYPGVPAPVVYFAYEPTSRNDAWFIDDLLSHTPGEISIDPVAYPWIAGQVVQDENAQGGEALFFSPQDPRGWVQGPFAELAPGAYTVTYRMKVNDNQDSQPVVRIYVGDRVFHDPAESRVYAQSYLSPSAFDSASSYQDFSLPFTVDRWASEVDLGLIYLGGTDSPEGDWSSAGLYLDSIHLTRDEPLDFPVFAMAALVLTHPVERDALELIGMLEQAGVLVLTPDEYMAALNPEFMIEWATPILGAEHPSLAQARAQLQDGAFFDSLLTVREALKDLPSR